MHPELKQYFDGIYADSDDPWHYLNRWYERRKRMLTLAVLQQPHYRRAIELGCANGILSHQLASRTSRLMCIDGHPRAVKLARENLQAYSHVEVLQAHIPDGLPRQEYDLIVISEVAYYLDQAQLEKLLAWALRYSHARTEILLCHWKYPIEGFELNSAYIHQFFAQHPHLHTLVQIDDSDFLLTVYSQDATSVAQQEGLL